MAYLKSDVVAKTYGSERHETVIKTVEVTPALVSRKYRGARRDNYTRKQAGRQHEIHLRRFGLLASKIRLCPPDYNRRKFIQPFADALEHHQS